MKSCLDNCDTFRISGKKRFINTVNHRYYYLKENCKECDGPFMASGKNREYCSPKCANISIIENQRDTTESFIDKVKQIHGDKYSYELVEYVDNNTKVKIICPVHGVFEQLPTNHKSGQGCGKCRKNSPVSWMDVKLLFELKNFTILSNESEWKSAFKDKVKFRCENGHTHSYTYTSLKNKNSECPYCNNTIKIEWDDIIKSFESEGWVVLSSESEYKNQNETSLSCICPNGHIQDKSVRKWRMGRRCQICVSSGPEIEVRNYISTIYNGEVIYNDRKTIDGLELDIYIPDKKLAIEYNGDYWHCNPDIYDRKYFHKHKNKYAYEIWEYDSIKTKRCNSVGVELLTLWESYPKDKIKNLIKSKIL